MLLSEAKTLKRGDHIHSLSRKNADGTPMRAKITSIKTWKRAPERIELRYKRGLFEYGIIDARELSQFGIGQGN